MSNNGPRYRAREGSRHDCCHEAQVIDTTKHPLGMPVCECWTIEDAKEIALALNRSAML